MKTYLPLVSRGYFIIITVFILSFQGLGQTRSTNYYAIANGDWNVNTSWSFTSGGAAVPVGIWPVAGDNVYISEGGTARVVTIPVGYAAACASITIGGSGSSGGGLELADASSQLAVSGPVILRGPGGVSDRYIQVDDGSMTVAGNLELGNGQTGTQGDRTCRVVIGNGMVSVGGDLVFHNIAGSDPAQTSVDMSAGAGTFQLAGAFIINNNSGTLNPGSSSTFHFNGSVAGQVIPLGISNVVYHHLTVANTHASGATFGAPNASPVITGNLSVQSGRLNNGGHDIFLADNMSFSVADGAKFYLTGTTTMVSVSVTGTKTFGLTSTVNYAGTDQLVTAENYGNLAFSGSGTKTLPAANILFRSSWINSGVTIDPNAGTVTAQGPTIQNIGGAGVSHFYDLVIDNPIGVVLSNDEIVNHTLTLTNGIIYTAASTLIVSNTDTGALLGSSSTRYIDGTLQRSIAAGVNTYAFPVGSHAAYSPVSIDFLTGTEAGALSMYTTYGDHASIGTSLFSPIRTVNRTWTANITGGLGTVNYDATFHWDGADEDPLFDYTATYVGKYDAGVWSYPAMGAMTASSAQILGEASLSDFQVGSECPDPPTATISGSAVICAGDLVTLQVDLTGTAPWSFTWSDGSSINTVTGVLTSPFLIDVYPENNTTYTLTQVIDGEQCYGTVLGIVEAITGPAAIAPDVNACLGEIVEVPLTVSDFDYVGAISLTLNYDKNVITYDSWVNNAGLIEYFHADESGATGVIRFTGTTLTTFPSLPDDEVLITLRFTHLGGSCDLEWNDSGDGTQCEFSTGAPDFDPYCDDPAAVYYTNGSVTESDPTLVADFVASNLFPPKNNDVTLTDLSTSGIPTAWQWSFDRTSVVFVNGTSATDQNPVVQFTSGGLYTVTLTIIGELCERTETKTGYIRAGRHGFWDGPTSADWYTATNWDDHLVSTILTEVVIPTRPVENVLPDPPYYYPNLPGNLIIGTHCNSVTLTGTGELRVDGILYVNGKVLDLQDDSKVWAGN